MTAWTIYLPLVAVVLSALAAILAVYLTHRFNRSRERGFKKEERDRQARYLAIRVVIALDRFVELCAEAVSDEGQTNQEGEVEPMVREYPDIEYPGDVDWRSIDSKLMYRLLALPNEVRIAKRQASFASEFAGPPDYSDFFEERCLAFGTLGGEAFRLASELRNSFELPALRTSGDWQADQVLKAAVSKTQKIRAERKPPPFLSDIQTAP